HPVTRPAAPRGPAVWQPCLVLARPARACGDLRSQGEPVRLRCSMMIDDEGGGVSPTKREREYARRRSPKRLARQERPGRIARRNRITAAAVVAVVVAAGAVTLILTQGEEPAPEAGSPSAATDPATEPATPGEQDGSDSLPTTDPRTYEAPPPET